MGPHDKDRNHLGFAVAILVSALGHAGLLYLVLFALPHWMAGHAEAPPVYTVKVVNSLPAGALGTHLPDLSGHRHPPERRRKTERRQEKRTLLARKEDKSNPPEKIDAPNSDKRAYALNIATRRPSPTPRPRHTPTPTPKPTPTPTPRPTATPQPTPTPTPQPTATPRPTPVKHPVVHHTARPTHTPRIRHTPEPTRKPRPVRTPERRREHHPAPRPTHKPEARREQPKRTPKSEPTPNVKEQFAKLKQKLLAERLKEVKRDHRGQETTASSSGPVAGNVAVAGTGYGVGPGTGSAGILKQPEFLMYYRAVQERVKKAWSFAGGNSDLTTTVDFSIGNNGQLTNIRITRSSDDTAFDDSVVRAIRRAAPFPPPPADFRNQFARGIEATFKLGDLNS